MIGEILKRRIIDIYINYSSFCDGFHLFESAITVRVNSQIYF